MGLFSQILTLPLAPLRGTVWVVDQVVRTAEWQYCDPEPVRRELAALERELLDGQIGEEEFDRREDELLDRLEQLEARRRQLEPPGTGP